jgi:hypothetical protein
MCLYIDTKLHPMIGDYDDDFNTVREPIVTKRPLVVWKYLELKERWKNGENNQYWVSPYRGMEYEFGKLYTATLDREDDEVEAGLHAYRGATKKDAQDNAGIYDEDAPHFMLFPSLIPAGSEIFVSYDSDGEVVSNQLIVFSDMKSLKAYTGVSRLARPVQAKNLKK